MEEDTKDELSEIEKFTNDLLFEKGLTNFEARKILLNKGLSPEIVCDIINKLKKKSNKEYKNRNQSKIIWGVVIFSIGLIASFLSDNTLFYGAIGYGGFKIADGFLEKQEL